MAERPRDRRAFWWCLYDWANSAFPTVITTFVFATYFTTAVAPDVASGTAAWGVAQAVAGIAIALLSAPIGALADAGAGRTRWLTALTIATALSTAMLWFIRPDPALVPMAVVMVIVATICFELGTVFYNALLPAVAPPHRYGRISGLGWGLGYFGGLMCLVAALFVLVQPNPPLLPLDREQAEHVRATALLVGLWLLTFGWPCLVFVRDRPDPAPPGAVRRAMAELWHVLRSLPRNPPVARFMVARLFYTDGLNTLFGFGAIYAAGKFGMSTEQVLYFGIALNVTAGLGAASFALIEDRLGARNTVLLSLVGLAVLGTGLLVVQDQLWFWALGLPLGLFMGPAQAASRSLMAKLTPPGEESAYFGLFAVSGRATAFVGPAVLAATVAATGSQTAGMATILVFLGAGFLILRTVRA